VIRQCSGRPTRYAVEQLLRKVLYLRGGEGRIAVAFEKVEDRDGEELGHDADVVAVVEVVDEVDAFAARQGCQSDMRSRASSSLGIGRVIRP
jgi:hypothetical protein